VQPGARRPAAPLHLYEFEACPFCRKVREALSILDLPVLVHPCPKGGRRFRPAALRRGGKLQFPYLEDPNTGKALYESDAIVAYLFEQYGSGRIPWALRPGRLTDLWLALAGLPRLGAGGFFRGSAHGNAAPVELYGFEASPQTRLIREQLCSLEVAYVLRNTAHGSSRRNELAQRHQCVVLPYLLDEKSSRGFSGSTAILRHIERCYGPAAREARSC
jgi:glutathione S-transferase